MTTPRVYVPVSTAEYARIYRVSTRTARRRLAAMPGAVKSGKGWRVPVAAKEYAARAKVSESTARRRGVRALDIAEALNPVPKSTPIQGQASETYMRLLSGGGTKRPVNARTVEKNMKGLTPRQARLILNADSLEDLDPDDFEPGTLNYH